MLTVQVRMTDGRFRSIDALDHERLLARFQGQLISTLDPRYAEASKVWNGMIVRKPGLIAQCSNDEDIMAIIDFARENSLLVSIRGGGHGVAGNALNDGGIVIDLSKMREARLSESKGTIRVQGGATIGDVDRETQAAGLAVPLGTVSETGVAGLSLHGGLGWLTRRYGSSADNIVSADVVTADGNLVRASSDENRDLLWAIRGGGGNFGVVTSFEFKTYPVGPQIWAAFCGYPFSRAKEALASFRDIMAKAPNELMGIAMLWSVPRMPFIEWLQGREALVIGAVYSGPFESGEAALSSMLRIPGPLFAASWPIRYSALQRSLDAEYPDGRRYYWKSAFVRELDNDLIDLLALRIKERPSPLSAINIWSLGGEFSMSGQESSFNNRDDKFFIGIEANWDGPDKDSVNVAWARQTYSSIIERVDAGVYLNFPGSYEEGDHMIHKAFGSSYSRLLGIKAKYDPENLFRSDFPLSARQ